MILSEAQLEDCWHAASRLLPVVIVGGGRWGLTWASVVARARGCGHGVTVVSRTRNAIVAKALAERVETSAVRVIDSLEGAFSPKGAAAQIAIIASRPADHLRDAVEALQLGAHTLVEKPLTADPADVKPLLAQARDAGRRLAIGTEFCMLPAFHRVARALGPRLRDIARIQLVWEDPADEVRHGAVKREHAEVSPLADLFPHALSIIRLFDPLTAHMRVESAPGASASAGRLTITSRKTWDFSFDYDKSGTRRQRLLRLSGDGLTCEIDFAQAVPLARTEGIDAKLPHGPDRFDSSLRLELGALILGVEEGRSISLIDQLPSELPLFERLLYGTRHCAFEIDARSVVVPESCSPRGEC